jgi:hypothetical protein
MVSYNCALDMSLTPWLSPSPRHARGLASLPWILGPLRTDLPIVETPHPARHHFVCHLSFTPSIEREAQTQINPAS